MPPEGEQTAAVVSVRGASLLQARTGLVLSLGFLLVLVASHSSWKVVGTLGIVQSVAGVYSALRAAFKFRSRLDDAVPLPTEAVEAFGRPKRPPMSWKQVLVGAAILIAGISGAVAIGWSDAPDFVAAVMAAVLADGFVRPLATAYLAARWERAHGCARLFRPFVRDKKNAQTLYATERPVPAA